MPGRIPGRRCAGAGGPGRGGFGAGRFGTGGEPGPGAVRVVGIQRLSGQHDQVTARQHAEHLPGPVQRLGEAAALGSALVDQLGLERPLQLLIPAVRLAERSGPDQLGQLAAAAGGGQRGQQLRGHVQVVGPGAPRAAPWRISLDSDDSASSGG